MVWHRTPGVRVGALQSQSPNEKKLVIYGYGVYEGDFEPPAGSDAERVIIIRGMKNPRIKLDNGEVVWGFQCWWAPEDQMKAREEKARAEGYEIITVSAEQELRERVQEYGQEKQT